MEQSFNIFDKETSFMETERKSLDIQPTYWDLKKLKKKNAPIEKFFIVAMLSVPILQFIVFWLVVNIQSIIMAFQVPSGEFSWDTFEYIFLSFRDGLADPLAPSLFDATLNSLLFWFTGVLLIPFNLFITYFLYKRITGYRLWQLMIYLPGIIGSLVMITAFKSMLRPDYGTLGLFFKKTLHLEQGLLYSPDTAIWVIVFYSLWMGWGNNMMLFGGAMARIPVELLESARLDGVGSLKEFIFIIFPLVWPTVSTVYILSLTTLFTSGGGILVFTGGNYGTYTLSYWMFELQMTGAWGYNKVSALGLILTTVTIPIVLFTRWLIEKIPAVDY